MYYIEILGAKTFLLKATMASEIHATAKTFDLTKWLFLRARKLDFVFYFYGSEQNACVIIS